MNNDFKTYSKSHKNSISVRSLINELGSINE